MRLRPVFLAFAVAACGGSQASPPPDQEPPPPAPGPVDEAPPVADDAPAADDCSGPPPGDGYECVQNCGPPVARADDPPPGYSWLTAEQAENRRLYGCPICLPAGARIATPQGDVDVAQLQVGDAIWTADAQGNRVAAEVVAVGSTPVAHSHSLTRVTLADGRIATASAPHPTAGGGPLGELRVGDGIDGSTVARVEAIPYGGARTWDVLPSGPTHLYWADGVQLRSTLGP